MADRQTLDEIEVAAAGLALGLLDGKERTDAMRRQLSDPVFAERVRAWQQVGDGWLEGIDPIEAPENLLGAIEAAIHDCGAETSHGPAVVGGNSLRLWRRWALTTTAASAILAVGLGIALLDRPGAENGAGAEAAAPTSPRQAANIAQIDDAEGVPLVSALYDASSGLLVLRRADLQRPGLAPELWVIPQDGVPRSLGMLESDRVTISISPELRAFLQDGAAMAVTLEPTDGELHEAPTGDILGTAILQEVSAGQT